MASITEVETFDPRITALKFESNIGPVLLACVYMPVDKGDEECIDCYIDICSKLTEMYNHCNVVNFIVMGDFNCYPGSRFYDIFNGFAMDNRLSLSDMSRLVNAFTYCSDNGLYTSWLDHLLCSDAVDSSISSIDVLLNFISSDHKPLSVKFNIIAVAVEHDDLFLSSNHICHTGMLVDWSRASSDNILTYKMVIDDLLKGVNIPVINTSDCCE